MDDQQPANESNEQGLNKIDLSQLQDFTFGTQWTEVKHGSPQQRREGDRGGERRDRRDDGGFGEPKRDRRTFRKPAGAPPGPGGEAGGAPGQRPPQGDRGGFGRPGFQGGDRPPRGDGGGFRGGPRRDFRGGGERRDFRGDSGAPFERGPYISPFFNITCYPEDAGFAAMVKAVRASCRTFQLFEITKAVLEKNDRFVVVIQRKPPQTDRPAQDSRPVEEGAVAAPAPAEPARAVKSAPLYMSQPDHLPFETEDAAIQHVLKNHIGLFFDTQEVEIDAPKGNFPIINKCGITGELLGPPNYHLYQQILQQHHATRLGRMPFEKFRDSIVSVREPEVVQAWLDKMKKATRYTWKTPAPRTGSIPPIPVAEAPVAPAAEAAPEAEAAAAAPAPAPEAPAAAPTGPSFDGLEEARAYLLTNAKDKVVRAVETVRFHGKLIEKLVTGEIKRGIEGHVERQRRFPLDTANALRGRLRREGFTIFKKGSRGVSYVCAVKRRFRVPGQVFSETISTLIDFIEKNPMIHVKDLPLKFLGIDIAAAIAATPLPEGAAPQSQSQSPFAVLPPDQGEKLRRMNNDLRWLVTEGYVTEFSDGKLFAPPPMTPQSAKRPGEHDEEHDPIDFPEAPPAAAAPATAAAPAEPASEAAPVAEPQPEAAPAADPEPAPAAPAEEPKPEGQA